MEHKASVRYETELFSLRSAALIMDEDRLLVCRNRKASDSFYTIGGGVRVGETTEEAVVREVFEETGRLLGIERLVFVQERFFSHDGLQHHELVFFYLMKRENLSIGEEAVMDQAEESMMWMPFDQLDGKNLIPAFLSAWLRQLPVDVVHVVSRE